MYSCVKKSLVNPWIDSCMSPSLILYPPSLLLFCDHSLHFRQNEENSLVFVRNQTLSDVGDLIQCSIESALFDQ